MDAIAKDKVRAAKRNGPTIKISERYLTIRYDGSIQLRLVRSRLVGFQSWIADGTYSIEYYLSGRQRAILTEYECRAHWKLILKRVSKAFPEI